MTSTSSKTHCKEICIFFFTWNHCYYCPFTFSNFISNCNRINIFINCINFVIRCTFYFLTWYKSHGFPWTWRSNFLITIFSRYFVANTLSHRRFLRCKHLWHFRDFVLRIVCSLYSLSWRLFPITCVKWFNSFFSATSINRCSNWTSRFYLRLHFCFKFAFEGFLNLFCLYFNLFLYFQVHFLNHFFFNNCYLFINMLFYLGSNCFIDYFSHFWSDGVLLLIFIHI